MMKQLMDKYEMRLEVTLPRVIQYGARCEDTLDVLEQYIPNTYVKLDPYGQDHAIYTNEATMSLVVLIDKSLQYSICSDIRVYQYLLDQHIEEVEQMAKGRRVWEEWWIARLAGEREAVRK